jgi:hypothetical protein
MLTAQRPALFAARSRAATVKVHASWQKATTKSALQAAGGKLVAELGGQVNAHSADRHGHLCSTMDTTPIRDASPMLHCIAYSAIVRRSASPEGAGGALQCLDLLHRTRPRCTMRPNPPQRVLIVEDAGEVFAVSNKCSHLGLPLQGKTALFTATVRAHAPSAVVLHGPSA